MEDLMVFADVRSMTVQLEVDAMTVETVLDSKMMEKGFAHKAMQYFASKRDVAAVVLDPWCLRFAQRCDKMVDSARGKSSQAGDGDQMPLP
jgi:hypothetical protein